MRKGGIRVVTYRFAAVAGTFFSGYSDDHFEPLPAEPALDRLYSAPLAGKAEGWPAPEAVAYLADRSVRAIGTDGPTLGGVDPQPFLDVYWVAATRGLFVIEFLANLAAIHGRKAFLPVRPHQNPGAQRRARTSRGVSRRVKPDIRR